MDRHLPTSQRISLYFRTSIQIGAILMILGIWLCTSMINIEELSIERRLQEVNTTIDGTTMSRWEADWDDEGRITSYGYDYYFIHPVLGQITNTSFSKYKKGKSTGGEAVKIYYDEDYPYINKIVGMDYAERGIGVLWLLIIPLVAIVFLVYGIYTVIGIDHLLKKGSFVWGNFLKHEKTLVKVNESQQYRLYYKYVATDGNSYTETMTTTAPSDFDNNEIVIYDENNPERMILLYQLPYSMAKYIEVNWEEVKKL